MTTKYLVVTAVAALILSVSGYTQTSSDLYQKGIHAQEAAGDLDGAIAIFRQVANAASSNKSLAAQAQFQLVLCMLQKGDRAAAQKELAALERNFSDMPDIVAKGRKLIPGASALLPEPWGDDESEQLDIKRDGVATGEYLYYSADAWTRTVRDLEQYRRNEPNSPYFQAVVLRWELRTKKSTRSITVTIDRDTRRPVAEPRRDPVKPQYASDDDLGDELATPFIGPATDVEESVFLLRRLPLAVGYKTSIPVTSNAIAPSQLELTVTGIESVQTTAGKFNCYKVSFAGIGQTFWIGVEGQRPLVKFQSGGVEAELVKVWGPENVLESLAAPLRSAGFDFKSGVVHPGGLISTDLTVPPSIVSVIDLKRYTPRTEIAQVLQRLLTEKTSERHVDRPKGYKVRQESIQTRTVGGQQALSCLVDYKEDSGSPTLKTVYAVWIVSEDHILEFWGDVFRRDVGTFRWRFDTILAAIRFP